MNYYTVLIFSLMFFMGIMLLFVSKSNSLNTKKKQIFYLLFSAIGFSALFEWIAFHLNGRGGAAGAFLLTLLIAVEHSLTPVIPFLFASVLDGKRKKPIAAYVFIHAVLEFASGIFGFIYYVDANGFYHHGVFYIIYVASYLIASVYMVFVVLKNIKKYQYGGSGIFTLIILYALSGAFIHLFNKNLRFDYITLGIGSAMSYVFTLEMIQQTDELTGLLNRRGYENYIKQLNQGCVILFFDVDIFKDLNDSYGHAFGDVVLKKIGIAIRKTYSRYGKCFRYGGDEFCVILTKHLDGISTTNHEFFNAMQRLRDAEPKIPNVSVGYAFYDPRTGNIQDAIANADKMMYKYKHFSKERIKRQSSSAASAADENTMKKV